MSAVRDSAAINSARSSPLKVIADYPGPVKAGQLETIITDHDRRLSCAPHIT
jgi:hypothetical protein